MEQLKGGIYITPKEISLVTGLHYKTAQKEHLSIRDALRIKNGRLTVRQFCQYNHLIEEEVVEYLNRFRD